MSNPTGQLRRHLDITAPRGPVRAVVLVLHGGRSQSLEPVRATQGAVLRMRPFAVALNRAGSGSGLAVARLRYAVRGWNGALRSPVGDAEAALDELGTRYPDCPIALVGHSMGGRTALWVAGHDAVRTVVGLAPWVEADDPVAQLAGRRLLVAHGDRDRTTDPGASARLVERVRPLAAAASYVRVAGDGHAMVRRPRLWHELATGYVLGTLFGTSPDRPPVLAEALAGAASLLA